MCSKWAGGLGGSWTAVRGTGSHIQRHQRREPGRRPVPEAAQRPARRRQPGRQAGRLRLRLPRGLAQRHPRLPRAAPQHRRRAPAHARHEHGVWIPDLFMKRVEARGPGRSSAPPTSPTCTSSTAARSRSATPPTRRARPRASSYGERIPAIELWKLMLRMLFETGHPWITFKDPCNVRSPQDHAGVVHSSNLCTEITLNTERRGDRGLQPRLDRARPAPDADGAIDHAAARDRAGRGAGARRCDRRQLLSDRGGRDGERAPPPGRARRDGPAVRALREGLPFGSAGGASSSATR